MTNNKHQAIRDFELKILDIISDNLEMITGQSIKVELTSVEELKLSELEEKSNQNILIHIPFERSNFGDWNIFFKKELGGLLSSSMIGKEPVPEFTDEQIEPLHELMAQIMSPYLSELSSIKSQSVETSDMQISVVEDLQPTSLDEDSVLVTISVAFAERDPIQMFKVVPNKLGEFLESSESGDSESDLDVGESEDEEFYEVDRAQFDSLDDLVGKKGNGTNINMLMDLEMPITIELGRTKLSIQEILALGQGSIVELDKLSGDPVDVFINDKRFARGEVVVVDENFGVRITEIISAAEKLKSLQ